MIHHLKIFWRSLGRNRVHSIITIGGFALSMAVVLILTAYIQSEKRYNRHYPNIDRTYLVVREDNSAAIRIFAVLAIVISCMGLFGLAEFQARRKIKEIGIRKVNGARISQVLWLLNKDFLTWVGIAFVIATPIAWYAMTRWLESFAYKTPLSWWIFALAGVLALSIALLTVSWQSWKAATRNPVESLRYE